MGGGGAMRAAAKLAGIGTITTGIRSTGSIENPVNIAVRPAASGVSSPGLTVENPVQRPVWEIDDWEFAASDQDNNNIINNNKSENEFVVDKNSWGKPRLVFGPVPSVQEAKDATQDLKDALDKVYLSSPKSAGSVESVGTHHETKACITQALSVSKSAMQAFRLLNESTVAQNVVASIACDPNVWNAVMQNSALVEYLESEKKSTMSENQDQESSDDSSDSSDPKKADGLIAFLENLKITVKDMVQNLTNMVQSWFTPSEGGKAAEAPYGSTGSLLASGSFMGLAMMVIMVVVLKRV